MSKKGKGIGGSYLGSEFTDEELDFLKAIDRHKRKYGKSSLTYKEVFYVALGLGYRKVEGEESKDSREQ